MSGPQEAQERFWDIAAPLMVHEDTEEGTIMNSRCLRVGGDFCAMVATSGQLVVKLPRERVDELIAAGVGEPFAPAGKVFREWMAVTGTDEELWSELMLESQTFIRGS